MRTSIFAVMFIVLCSTLSYGDNAEIQQGVALKQAQVDFLLKQNKPIVKCYDSAALEGSFFRKLRQIGMRTYSESEIDLSPQEAMNLVILTDDLARKCFRKTHPKIDMTSYPSTETAVQRYEAMLTSWRQKREQKQQEQAEQYQQQMALLNERRADDLRRMQALMMMNQMRLQSTNGIGCSMAALADAQTGSHMANALCR